MSTPALGFLGSHQHQRGWESFLREPRRVPRADSDRSQSPAREAIASGLSFWRPRKAHSHMVRTRQPWLRSSRRLQTSWSRLVPIFSNQNRWFVSGTLKRWQRWPCQKQPWTNTTAWYFGNTRSGFPGRPARLSLYRKPDANSSLRPCSSGFVFALRIRDMQ